MATPTIHPTMRSISHMGGIGKLQWLGSTPARDWLLKRKWALFLFALLWSAYLLLVGALPHLVSGTSINSLTFEYRDYLLRAFVVFAVAHLFVRKTNFKLLIAIPPITLALQLGLDVYDFSEWYSRTFRVNLHELNAQLFVVPVQLMVLATGIYFCCRKHLRTTTRIFATTMLAGSIVSTLGFHLSIVNVTYKPVERVYADNLRSLVGLDDPADTCRAMDFDCQYIRLGRLGWDDDHLLDPQLPIAHNAILAEALSTHAWVRRGEGLDHWLGIATAKEQGAQVAETLLPLEWLSPLMESAYGGLGCNGDGAQCYVATRGAIDQLPSFSRSIIDTLLNSEAFIHAWLHVYDFDGDGFVEPALFAAGRRSGAQPRLVVSPLPQGAFDRLTDSISDRGCSVERCLSAESRHDLHASSLPASVQVILEQALAQTYDAPSKLWVDKALSRNPVLYINRPEFLRVYAFKDGVIRVFTSPQAFSDTTLDLKLTFNLIIGLFSVSWLTLGVFLILFHTRRQLLAG
ncbi:hypothetical protein ACIRUG_33995 (plasmid) [Pseudomonas aeruginosa]|uniref:hypothetical protein n=1 Tax=Ectopseudomonas TaxID=3236654 RepID=UPI0005F111D7|nr:hypothetical protein [Pseudomonas guguanensis]MDR8015458.1 hypothetical protein [Pseudomonas guguanensis]OWG35973.1 hypothetical protein CAQ69_23430 [Stutzerimonas stutzeri]HCF2988309.1 hypothetical protein [Pseudomonas aeruginosa]